MHKATLRILLADDNSSNAELLRYIIQKLGFRLEIVHDGQQALKRCLEEEFDLVLMDIQMPVMDGLEATRRIRESGDHNRENLRIVALTGMSMRNTQEHCHNLGLDDCIIKPYRVKEIEECINRMCYSPLAQ